MIPLGSYLHIHMWHHNGNFKHKIDLAAWIFRALMYVTQRSCSNWILAIYTVFLYAALKLLRAVLFI